jgi:rhamnose utilization protein RhaD (predicted bifunctional aldolase and dehydrogenase)
MTARDFTPLRLQEIEPLFGREEMSDEEMVAHLARCQLDPAAPRSSIETLLHAFIPAAHVHHTHPDAINVLACAREGRELVADCFGEEAAWIEYIRPGFTLAKQVGEVVRSNPQLRVVVLAKHGLVVWGDTARAAYEQTVAVCNQAADFANRRAAARWRFGGRDGGAGLDEGSRQATLHDVLPALRGVVSSQRAKILITDTSLSCTPSAFRCGSATTPMATRLRSCGSGSASPRPATARTTDATSNATPTPAT